MPSATSTAAICCLRNCFIWLRPPFFQCVLKPWKKSTLNITYVYDMSMYISMSMYLEHSWSCLQKWVFPKRLKCLKLQTSMFHSWLRRRRTGPGMHRLRRRTWASLLPGSSMASMKQSAKHNPNPPAKRTNKSQRNNVEVSSEPVANMDFVTWVCAKPLVSQATTCAKPQGVPIDHYMGPIGYPILATHLMVQGWWLENSQHLTLKQI